MPKRELPPVPNTLSDDPFVFEDDPTDWNKVYSSSSDKQGHSESVRFNAPKSTSGQVRRLIAKTSHPAMQTVADFVRDAVYHAMEVRNQMGVEDPDVTQWLEEQRADILREQVTQQRESTKRLVENYTEDCQAAWNDGDYDMLRRHLIAMADLIVNMREPFKAKLSTVLDTFNTKLINLI